MKNSRIRINTNLSAEHYFIFIIIIAILFLVIGIYHGYYFWEKQDYVKVNAIITGSSDSRRAFSSTTNHYYHYEYYYNNKVYKKSQRTFADNAETGKQINIYLNPDNPEEVVDFFAIRISLLANFMLLVFLIFTIHCYKIRKSM